MTTLKELVTAVRDVLQAQHKRLVLVESCTAGRVAGSLAIVPGISQWLCGSLVVYRNDAKAKWLGIPADLLDDPHIGPVSTPVTELLSQRALLATPEADVAAAVTGHIGPGCPVQLDGVVFFCLTQREPARSFAAQTQLRSAPPHDEQDLAARQARLEEATHFVLTSILQGLMP